jgi:hypothetical protein
MPVKFEIYREGKRLTQFTPVGAMAMGPESVPIPGEIAVKDGTIAINRTDDHAVGIALLWDVGQLGEFHLETTRLKPREQAYILNVELARFRLMRIMQKQEDWNLFDFPKAEKFAAKFKEAQLLFAEALGMLGTPEQAAAKADAALAMAIELSEELAAFHSELLINRRRASGAFVRHIVGCRADPAVQNLRYRELLAQHFDYAVVPMSWRMLQPEEEKFETQPLDEFVDLLTSKRIPIVAGPLIDLHESHVPDWMFVWEHDFDTLRELAYEYVQKLVHRYRKAVSMWNVAAGLHAGGAFTLSFEQMIEFTRLLVSQVKTMLPNARTIVTIKQPFGEYHAKFRSSVPPVLYAEMVAQAGINFEAFGLEIEMGIPQPGKFTRDLFQLSCLLDRFSQLGRPIFITAVGAPGQNGPDSGDISDGRMNPAEAGRWKRPWDPQLQAEWMEAVYRLALSKPFVESIAWSNLADIHQTLPGGGLMNDMFQPKPAFMKLQEMREKFHQWHGKKG